MPDGEGDGVEEGDGGGKMHIGPLLPTTHTPGKQTRVAQEDTWAHSTYTETVIKTLSHTVACKGEVKGDVTASAQ